MFQGSHIDKNRQPISDVASELLTNEIAQMWRMGGRCCHKSRGSIDVLCVAGGSRLVDVMKRRAFHNVGQISNLEREFPNFLLSI